MDPSWLAPIRSGAHLAETFEYQLGQNLHHGDVAHPATWSASSFVDLVGARAVEGLDPVARLREAMPRYRLRFAFRAVGLPPEPLVPATAEQIRAAGLQRQRVVDAAAAACCANPSMLGRSAPVVRARVCAASLAREAGFGTRELAQTLHVSSPTARRLLHARSHTRSVEATKSRLAIEDAVARATLARSGSGAKK